ncbi:putative glycosyltransferase/ rhamnosyltransferase [Mycolicibacterium celeriflavum]|uniref:Putative glycosyltransferase/ rhamnosyltransferase n=2 Tax=Mycolicibacterium celeriflavum TaxID=1249101 RepID=A0A7I7RPM6_MYCCF|nr:putative glycosyltransferase/ rhamnosyltransferase [Mycolicibacterium celeriflavum]
MMLESDFLRKFWEDLPGSLWSVRDVVRSGSEHRALITRSWTQMSKTLTSLARRADVLVTGLIFERLAAHVAAYYSIPLATIHMFPVRPNGSVFPSLPPQVCRPAMRVYCWLDKLGTKELEETQRLELGMLSAAPPSPRGGTLSEHAPLEIQAYEHVCFPGLTAEWRNLTGKRPFVGTLTLELPTDADAEVASWIAAGTPPIYFGFGSMLVDCPADTLAMITAVSGQLGERALFCSGLNSVCHNEEPERVKVVPAVNHAAILPACRSVVHHGGSGTTAAALRAGVPQLILSMLPEQARWGAQVRRMKVGAARRFSRTNRDSLTEDLRTILTPEYAARARKTAARTTKSGDSVVNAADLLERLHS